IGQGLQGNNSLTHLYLNNNQIGDIGASVIGQGLQGNNSLRYLYLNNNQISFETVTILNRQCNHIQYLNISSQRQQNQIKNMIEENPLNLQPEDFSLESWDLVFNNDLSRLKKWKE